LLQHECLSATLQGNVSALETFWMFLWSVWGAVLSYIYMRSRRKQSEWPKSLTVPVARASPASQAAISWTFKVWGILYLLTLL
jgi:hypothetical protein